MEGRSIEKQIRSLLQILIHKWSPDSVKTARLVYDQFTHWQALILDHQLEANSSTQDIDTMLLSYRKAWAEFENLVRLQLVRWKMDSIQSENQLEASSIRFNIAMWEESITVGSPETLIARLSEQLGSNDCKNGDD